MARLRLPARGAQDRQAALPGPLQAFHRALLGAFLSEAGPPDLAAVDRLAAELLDQSLAVEAARRIFGGLLYPTDHDPAWPPPT